MTIYEDSRTVSRADLAAWLRQLANQLESDGQVYYGAAGVVPVADQVECELEIERESDTEISIEIEFTWRTEAPEPAEPSDEPEPAETAAEGPSADSAPSGAPADDTASAEAEAGDQGEQSDAAPASP